MLQDRNTPALTARSVVASLVLGTRRGRLPGSALVRAATLFGLGWLVLILGVLLWEGFSGLSLQVFTEMTPPPGADGGLLNPIIGSLILTTIEGALSRMSLMKRTTSVSLA